MTCEIEIDFNAAEQDGGQAFFFSEEIQTRLARRLNALVNIPLMSNKREGQIILKVVQSLDRNTFKFVPKEILEATLDRDQSVPGEFREALRENLPDLLAGLIPFPFLPRFVKEALVRRFVAIVVDAMERDNSMDAQLF